MKKGMLIGVAAAAACLAAAPFVFGAIVSPCRGSRAAPAAAMPQEERIMLENNLRRHVEELAGRIGERNMFHPGKLEEAARYVRGEWEKLGFEVREQEYEVRGMKFLNLWVEIPGTGLPGEIVVAGAHYDSVKGSPGADDNGSGVAGLLELSRILKAAAPPARTLRFAAFTNEEPPFFKTPEMGSMVFAREMARRRENVKAMISLETIGYFSDEKGSQQYPPPLDRFYPDTGNFIGIVGNLASRDLVKKVGGYFKEGTALPCECAAVPENLPGVDWSDHASFWEHGFPAVMVTDTAPYRNPYYHEAGDLPGTLRYSEFAETVRGLAHVLERLSREK